MVELTGLEEIEMGRIKPDEVKTASKQTKRRKAPGPDDVTYYEQMRKEPVKC